MDHLQPDRSSPYCYDALHASVAVKFGSKFSRTSRSHEKPAETRMGSGKGSPEYWVAVVKPGRVMFEIGGVSEETAREALRLACNKLPIKCKFVSKEDGGLSSNESY